MINSLSDSICNFFFNPRLKLERWSNLKSFFFFFLSKTGLKPEQCDFPRGTEGYDYASYLVKDLTSDKISKIFSWECSVSGTGLK